MPTLLVDLADAPRRRRGPSLATVALTVVTRVLAPLDSLRAHA